MREGAVSPGEDDDGDADIQEGQVERGGLPEEPGSGGGVMRNGAGWGWELRS